MENNDLADLKKNDVLLKIGGLVSLFLIVLTIYGVINTISTRLIEQNEKAGAIKAMIFISFFLLVTIFYAVCIYFIRNITVLTVSKILALIVLSAAALYFVLGLLLETTFHTVLENWISTSTAYFLISFFYYRMIKIRINRLNYSQQ